MTSVSVSHGAVEDVSDARPKVSKVERRTAPHKRHLVKSIRSGDGDIIDCIDIYKQPALDHPALANHTIQVRPFCVSTKMKPSYVRRMEPITITASSKSFMKEDSPVILTSQLWHKSGSCPKGTIPIRRTRKKDVLESNKFRSYGRKEPMHHAKHFVDQKSTRLAQGNHSLAVLVTEGYSYSAAKGDIKVWNPYVECRDDYSTSGVSLKNGGYHDYESIEAGWAVNPSVYEDNKTRLFVYWTADGSRKTGCFDLTCPGFVQTNHDIALGAAIYPISNPNGLPYEITVHIYQDPNTKNWWLQYGERINIGYWPPELFNSLRYQAVTVQWGGEVYSSKVGIHPNHTATAMGSGQFPDFIFGTSGSIKRMRISENSHELKFPEWVNSHTDEYDCYNVLYHGDYVQDPEFYYGGPGRSERCP
ncbi:hypothetical protein RJ639_042833 [Escallonia herrerae]|uniref:Neprosin PEP catalytic domain-containing protein n=1 Tax=Escallonia herrerae TaxID=1293975 RepID=A0AA89B0G0_9ASTE|nr:hypothetical protein RJ639_042833 [Escallonia herrerae]